MTTFFEAYPWRQIVTNLDSETLTFLDHLAMDRSISFARNAPTVIAGKVPADNPEVNLGTPPFLNEGNRLIYCFRREGGPNPWRVRAAGIVLDLHDEALGDNAPVTGYTAYDPWKYLYRRPVLERELGTMPPTLPVDEGITYELTTGNAILIQQLEWSEELHGPMFLDYGQTEFYEGTIESTPVIAEINFQRGSSIGELMDTLVATGKLDLKIDPVYDPVNRPGIVGELSIRDRVGSVKPQEIFGWDQWPRNVVDISRVDDGLLRMNSVLYYAGLGGVPSVIEEDAASIAKYGVYFEQRFWPGQDRTAAVQAMAARTLKLLKNGQQTYTLTPSAERAPVPLLDYDVGDEVPVYGSKRLRSPIAESLRIEGIPIVIGNDQLERVTSLLVAEDAA